MEVSNEVKERVKQHRLTMLEEQIADAQIDVAIYEKMLESCPKEDDQRMLDENKKRLKRLILAYETVKES